MTRLKLRVSPRAKRNAILGLRGDTLKVSVTAVPERGKANDAVVELLAGALGVAPSSIELVSGGSSKDKVVEIPLDPDEIARRLA
ncbi:MAG TPA: DUF167 domain-containing protein [Candidatus Polarisedimenticolaceae bacterium]|nr:DUF167 domain-containing protein [Candidatus Polarisedimenticolaceae bacterium]